MSITHLNDLAWIYTLFVLHLIVPGPSTLYICASASCGQRRRALAFVAGTTVGTASWVGFVMLGAWRLTAEAPLFLGGLKLLVGLTLVALGARAVLAAFAEHGIEAASGGSSPAMAFLHGVLLTMASVNELVFWTAILALGAGAMTTAGHDPAFAAALVAGIVVLNVACEGTLACIATSGGIARLMRRLRRPLEAALGFAFCLTGAALLRLV